jgi:hypothetical protein
MTKYYVTLNTDNEIQRPYSDEGGFMPPSGAVEITEEQLSEYLSLKNQGLIVVLEDNIIHSYDKSLSPTNIKNKKITTIKTLLSETDKTQFLDNRLSNAKQIEFATYRDELRVILGDINSGAKDPSFELPVKPKYE